MLLLIVWPEIRARIFTTMARQKKIKEKWRQRSLLSFKLVYKLCSKFFLRQYCSNARNGTFNLGTTITTTTTITTSKHSSKNNALFIMKLLTQVLLLLLRLLVSTRKSCGASNGILKKREKWHQCCQSD